MKTNKFIKKPELITRPTVAGVYRWHWADSGQDNICILDYDISSDEFGVRIVSKITFSPVAGVIHINHRELQTLAKAIQVSLKTYEKRNKKSK